MLPVLEELYELLVRYDMNSQARIVRQIADAIREGRDFLPLINSVDMWGGPGAVWEVHLPSSGAPRAAQLRFRDLIIELVDEMGREGIDSPRAEGIASTFRHWKEQGI